MKEKNKYLRVTYRSNDLGTSDFAFSRSSSEHWPLSRPKKNHLNVSDQY